jgi:hypothetical protein
VLTLPTGLTFSATYAVSGAITGEQMLTTTIDGPATFEGQSLTQVTTTTNQTGSTAGLDFTSTAVVKAYRKAAGGTVTEYGSLSTVNSSSGGVAAPEAASKLVYTPSFVEQIYTLALGQSFTQTVTAVVTVTAPTPQPPTTTTTTATTTYVADESINVLGKTYSTCKFEISNADGGVTTSWLLVGKGIGVKAQSTSAGVTQLTELKSGTYNGAPL